MRLESSLKVSRLSKYVLFVYVVISLVYTTHHYFSAHRANQVQMKEYKNNFVHQDQPWTRKQEILQRLENIEKQKKVETKSNWALKGGKTTHSISHDFMKSKIFSSSMGLDHVTPYYFKATQIKNKQDITLATLVTRNRFHVLSRLATNYQGPISAAIHVMDDKEKSKTIGELNKIYKSNPDMQAFVDVHLIVDKYDRQFNMWRNTAKLFTRTDYLMMLDVDFHLCTNFRQSIWENAEWSAMLQSGKTAFVVPAFEYLDQKDGLDWHTFPRNKAQVIKEVEDLKLDSFHSAWVSGHGATNYSLWYNTQDAYPVTEYEYSYEPYVIYKKEGTPWCDERFIGYGANKAACLYEIFVSGVDFWVLPNDFLIHQSHKYANHDRTRERVHNKELYANFRTEVCLRYSRKYVIEGTWYSSEADNMKKVCTNIPKWKYLSGIPKAQREADAAAEKAEREAMTEPLKEAEE
ncbi:hypothetical protein G6F56_007934 [Rhizopus delemar]|uniref:Glycosyltransferase family 49 protein n=1 Tax=Rhizopus stolonifer TaxID=4846 RepID=A0A367IQ06_RHIST|nr:hypothetical protein G6F56_007934 [Rhizopus delemar]RCH79768.1 hypothetical protein CU098_004079 [Rhizopus stolonifer]